MTGSDQVADRLPVDLAPAEELHRRAVAENLAGHPARGSRLVGRGLRRLSVRADSEPDASDQHPGRDKMVARLLATLAKSTVETTGLEPGLELMDRALRWAGTVRDDRFAAFLVSQRGLIYFRGGRLSEARIDLDDAVRRIPDDAGIDKWRVLLNRGALSLESGRLREARSDLSRSAELAGRLGLIQERRISLHNLGCLEFVVGDLPLALRTIDAGIALDRESGVETQAGIALLDRARVLLAAGLRAEADETLAEAATLLARDRNWQDVGEVELTRSEIALLSGASGSARRLATRSRDRFRRHGNARWRRNAELVLLQADLRSDRPPARLLPPARRLASEFAAAGFPRSARTALLLAAELAERRQDLAAAAALARQAGPVRPEDPIDSRLQTRYVRARLDLAAGHVRAARRQLVTGLTDLAGYRAQFGSIELQAASAIHGVRLAELDVRVALAGGRPAQVLAATERSRAASRRLQPVMPPADEVAAASLADLRLSVDRLQRLEADADRTEADAGERHRLRRRVGELQRQLRTHAWRVEGSRRSARPPSISELRESVAEAASTMVCYLESDGELHAVAVAGDRLRLFPLGPLRPLLGLVQRVRADLDLLALARVPAAVAAAARRSLDRDLAAIDAVLAVPLAGGTAIRGTAADRAVILPTATLAAVPWNMLPALRDRAVVVAPSASAWLRARRSVPAPVAAPVVALAGPDLRRGADEIAAVTTRWREVSADQPAGCTVTDLPTATGADLAAALGTPGIVHVAAHGTHQSESPMFSSIRLHGGPVFAYELDRTRIASGQVVLSACDLGAVTPREGGEALGLGSVLLHLGVPCVVAGVAHVNDETAAVVMSTYHRELARGTDSAEALAVACSSEASALHPAPFVCFGAPTVHAVPRGGPRFANPPDEDRCRADGGPADRELVSVTPLRRTGPG